MTEVSPAQIGAIVVPVRCAALAFATFFSNR